MLDAEKLKTRIRGWSSPSVYASALLLLTNFFFWDGVDLLTPFIFPLLAAVVVIVFGCVFVGASMKAFRSRGEGLPRRFRFVAVDLATALIATFFPFTEFRNYCDFNLNLDKRMEVVEMAKEGKLANSRHSRVCALPAGWEYLSKGGGEVIVSEAGNGASKAEPRAIHIFFFTFRGIMARHAGFDYSSDGSPPPDVSEAKAIKRLRNNWYWVSY